MIVVAWFILQIGGLFNPGLLDDVDSIYIEIAREMLHRHDFVTPYVDGIRFFDKPPLMYWMAAGSMKLFGEFDWAARLPLALATLALFLAVYALGLRIFRSASPVNAPDRGALYSALALATSIGPYLYTRFYIPDIMIALWMTLSVHLFLIAIERAEASRSAIWPCLGFAATLALNLLTKGLIGILFPIGFVVVYLAITKKLPLLLKFHPFLSSVAFLAIALPWHLLAWVRNPAIAMPAGQGLPAKAGWAWFYLYNEHFARFLGKRIPHDYGQTPVWLFWVYAMMWVMPWAVFLPAAIKYLWSSLSDSQQDPERSRDQEAGLTVTIWSLLVLLFFTFSSRQEYYSVPALPALALMAGGWLARAEWTPSGLLDRKAYQWSLDCHRWLLLPLVSLAGMTCAFFAIEAPTPQPGADLSSLLSNNPQLYNLSLGHLFDLTGAAMGLFRGPLTAVAIGMAALGPVSYGLRRVGRTFSANIAMALGMTLTLLAAHEGLVRFNPILGSKGLAEAILATQHDKPQPNDLILMDGEYTFGSTLTFYTRQTVGVVNGRVNTLWFGGFWPDAPAVFENDASLKQLWGGPRRVFLMTPTPASRTTDLQSFGTVKVIASDGGKTVLVNR
jgi:4-amino-4-deoxy-L-arabinose transferase-like glycosyltransferase